MACFWILQYCGVASMGQGGQSASLDSENIAKNRGKEEKIGKKRKNLEEKAKIGKILSLCPS